MLNYGSSLKTLKIDRYEYNVHEDIIVKYMKPGSTICKISFGKESKKVRKTVCDHLIRCFYRGEFDSLNDDLDIYIYEFHGKYCKDIELCDLPRIKKINEFLDQYHRMLIGKYCIRNEDRPIIKRCVELLEDVFGVPIDNRDDPCKTILFDSVAYRKINLVDVFVNVNDINPLERKLLVDPLNLAVTCEKKN